MLKKFEQSLVHLKQIKKGDKLILAVSGGRDSMVMLHLFNALRKKWKFDLLVGHVNHTLRGEESDEDEKFVIAETEKMHLPVNTISVDVRVKAKKENTSIQNAARMLRYESLERMRIEHNAQWVGTAHHADDNAETILAHLFRGSGISGLQGIRPIRGNIIRPLLFATSPELHEYAIDKNILWREDSSNAQNHYMRNVIRHDIIPEIIGKVNPNFISTISDSSNLFQSLNDFIHDHIQTLSRECFQTHGEVHSLAIPALKKYFDFEQFALIQRAVIDFCGFETTLKDVVSIKNLLDAETGKVVQLRNGVRIFREHDSLVFSRKRSLSDEKRVFETGETIISDEYELTIQEVAKDQYVFGTDPNIEFIDAEKTSHSWTVRRWKFGDRFIPFGTAGTQKVSDFLVNKKIPHRLKENIFVLESDGNIVWLCGLRLDDRYKISDSTRTILKLSFHRLKNA